MSSRTSEELIDAIDRDLAWRKKEMSALRFAVDTSPDAEQSFMIRSAIALLYAHWEGYVKDAAGRYLRFVRMRRLLYAELATPFAALGIRNEARRLVNSVEPEDCISSYKKFIQSQANPSNLPQDGGIKTGSNLDYRHFRRILSSIGIDWGQYKTRAVMIDKRLLAHRNKIAHGNVVWPDLLDYHELHEAVIDMLTKFQQQVADAASSKSYRCA